MTTHIPANYNLANHLAEIFRSPEYAEAAKQVGLTVEQFQHDVTVAVTALTEEQRKEELKVYEKELSEQAIAHALGKFRGDLEGELKKLVAARRSKELADFSETVKKTALVTAKAKAIA
jgi:ribosome recycling factor